MDSAATIWKRLIRPHTDVSLTDDLMERWTVRNATCLLGATSSFMGVFVFMAIGQAELFIAAGFVALGFLAGFELSRRHHRRLAALMAIVPLEGALLYNTFNFGAGLFESAYLMCVCIAYLMLESEDAVVLYGILVFTSALVIIGVQPTDEPPMALSMEQRRGLLAATVIMTLSNMATVLFYFLSTRRQASLRLREALAQAHEASAAKSSFLANTSHEIRTPMNGVIGMLSVLEHSGLEESQRDYVETALHSSRSLVAIINDLLDLSKVEAGHLSLEREPLDLRALAETAGRLAAVQARERAVDVIIDYPPGVPGCIVGDPGRIRQVLTNLLNNALKFTETGHVVLSAHCRQQTPETASLELSVTDTGIGIPEAQLETIFDKFRQVDDAARRRAGGTGLGLAIVRELVTAMGGTIDVESELGQGSRFYCRLEFALDADVSAAPTLGELAGGRALIVDQRTERVRPLRQWLQHWGLAVESCTDAPAARALLDTPDAAERPYHLVFMDLTEASQEVNLLAQTLRDGASYPRSQLVPTADIGARPASLDPAAPVSGARLYLPLRRQELAQVLEQIGRGQYALRIDSDSISRPSFVARPWPEGLSVLVVDDNPINQKVARKLLENLGCRVQLANNGREALTSLQQQSFDLVFLDLQMPEMDGFETTQRIRALDCGAGVPLVAMTAHAMDDDRESCLAAGMDAFLSKPVEQGDIAAVLQELGPRFEAQRQAS